MATKSDYKNIPINSTFKAPVQRKDEEDENEDGGALRSLLADGIILESVVNTSLFNVDTGEDADVMESGKKPKTEWQKRIKEDDKVAETFMYGAKEEEKKDKEIREEEEVDVASAIAFNVEGGLVTEGLATPGISFAKKITAKKKGGGRYF